jgi:hypothetical protein
MCSDDFPLQVLSQPDAAQQGFDPSIFINPKCLHLTLLMLKLYSDEARHKAAQALQGMQTQVRLCICGARLSGWQRLGCQRSEAKTVANRGGLSTLRAACKLVSATVPDGWQAVAAGARVSDSQPV